MDEKKIEELLAQIADLKGRWPKHSVPPGLMLQLDDLEEELALARRAMADKKKIGGDLQQTLEK